MPSWAFATLLTSDSYLPGALVTARSIKDCEGIYPQRFDLVCLVTLDSVSVQSIKALRQIYDLVVSVEEIRSTHSQDELNLLGRQDLASTITKIHIWRLTQYDKVIYLDSDTLLLRSISHLFELESPFSACPDIGWPDCFNSGLMVITPNSQTFESIFQHFLAHGSWDGGDQGILNDYFSPSSTKTSGADASGQSKGWDRLSFIYNVTPSAYYTYAPAYKRYSDKVSMVHFIGREKPWHLISRRRYRNAYFPNQNTHSLNAINYDSLIDIWLDVYEKVAGPVEPSEWGSIQPQFQVPKYLSQWDSDQPSVYNPPTLENLKEIFSRKKAHLGPDRLNQEPIANQTGYISLPFLDLSSLAQKHFARKQGQSHHHPNPASQPEGLAQPQPHSVLNQSDQSASHSVWDAARSSPPSKGYQMNHPITHRYESAWDKPFDQQSHNPFQPPPMSYSIPPVTHQDYSQYSTAPQPQALKSVFPWEGLGRPHSGRVFPEEEKTYERKISSSDSLPHQGHYNSKSASSAINQFSLRDIYRNAWDEDPMIGRWAHAKSFSTSGNRTRQGWGKFEEAQAGLARTPRLELKHLHGDQQEIEGKKKVQGECRKEDDVGRLHSFRLDGNLQFRRGSATVTSPSYLSERDFEASSQDADEEDAGEDEDQSSDIRNTMADETCSEGTIRTPTEPNKTMDPDCENEKTEKVPPPKHSISRIPIIRSVIIGVPIKNNSSSHSANSESDGQSDNKKNLIRTSTEPMTY